MKGWSLLCRNNGIVYADALPTPIGNIFLLLSPELWAATGDAPKVCRMKMERKWPFTETRQTLLLPAGQASIISDKACHGRTWRGSDENVSLPRWSSFQKPMHVWAMAQSCLTFCNPPTIAHQAPLSMGFSRQEYWGGLPCPPPGDLPDPGIETVSPASPALQTNSLLLRHWGSPSVIAYEYLIYVM